MIHRWIERSLFTSENVLPTRTERKSASIAYPLLMVTTLMVTCARSHTKTSRFWKIPFGRAPRGSSLKPRTMQIKAARRSCLPPRASRKNHRNDYRERLWNISKYIFCSGQYNAEFKDIATKIYSRAKVLRSGKSQITRIARNGIWNSSIIT